MRVAMSLMSQVQESLSFSAILLVVLVGEEEELAVVEGERGEGGEGGEEVEEEYCYFPCFNQCHSILIYADIHLFLVSEAYKLDRIEEDDENGEINEGDKDLTLHVLSRQVNQ